MIVREDHYAHTLERRALVAECKDILHRMDPTYPPAKRDCLMALDRCLEAVNASWPDHSARILALGFLEGYYVGVRSPEGAQADSVYAKLALAAKHIANARMPEPREPEDDADPDLSAPRRLIAELQAQAQVRAIYSKRTIGSAVLFGDQWFIEYAREIAGVTGATLSSIPVGVSPRIPRLEPRLRVSFIPTRSASGFLYACDVQKAYT